MCDLNGLFSRKSREAKEPAHHMVMEINYSVDPTVGFRPTEKLDFKLKGHMKWNYKN